ncbi:uncharacterized protein [Panulirus ornatus]|uniref:uncharacterized protein isoform X2 n=1 Tax=Panulirus ornatus TaxID=150431 RepID=UPI003A8BBB8B
MVNSLMGLLLERRWKRGRALHSRYMQLSLVLQEMWNRFRRGITLYPQEGIRLLLRRGGVPLDDKPLLDPLILSANGQSIRGISRLNSYDSVTDDDSCEDTTS